MKACDTCGNVYDKSFELIHNGQHHTFDSFECAITKCAPRCDHCGCSIIGHGAEAGARLYCCAHCARQHGASEIRDRAT